MRRDLHVGSGISRHLHRLFASSPMINSPALPITFSLLYIHTCEASFQFAHNDDPDLRTEIYLREDRATGVRRLDLSLLSQTDFSDDTLLILKDSYVFRTLYKAVELYVFQEIFITLRACIYDP